jgi:hypothetical protein
MRGTLPAFGRRCQCAYQTLSQPGRTHAAASRPPSRRHATHGTFTVTTTSQRSGTADGGTTARRPHCPEAISEQQDWWRSGSGPVALSTWEEGVERSVWGRQKQRVVSARRRSRPLVTVIASGGLRAGRDAAGSHSSGEATSCSNSGRVVASPEATHHSQPDRRVGAATDPHGSKEDGWGPGRRPLVDRPDVLGAIPCDHWNGQVSRVTA